MTHTSPTPMKRLTALFLSFLIAVSSSLISAGAVSADKPPSGDEVPEEEMATYYFLAPDDWCNTEKGALSDYVGIYWWENGGCGNWPGIAATPAPEVHPNAFKAEVPNNNYVATIIFNAFVDAGGVVDSSLAAYAHQTINIVVEEDNYDNMIYVLSLDDEHTNVNDFSGAKANSGDWFSLDTYRTSSNYATYSFSDKADTKTEPEKADPLKGTFFFDCGDWNSQNLLFYVWDGDTGECATKSGWTDSNVWGSRKKIAGTPVEGKAGVYESYEIDFAGREDHELYVIFHDKDTNEQTFDCLINETAIGKTASRTGNKLENPIDSTKKADEALFDGGTDLGPAKVITSSGKIQGKVISKNADRAGVVADFVYNYLGSLGKSAVKDTVSQAYSEFGTTANKVWEKYQTYATLDNASTYYDPENAKEVIFNTIPTPNYQIHKGDILTLNYNIRAVEGVGAVSSRITYNNSFLKPYNQFDYSFSSGNATEKECFYRSEKALELLDMAGNSSFDTGLIIFGINAKNAKTGAEFAENTVLATITLEAIDDFDYYNAAITLATTKFVVLDNGSKDITSLADDYFYLTVADCETKDPDTDKDSDLDTDTQSDIDTDSVTDTQPDTDSDSDTDTQSDIDTDSDTDIQSDTDPDSDTDTQSDTDTDSYDLSKKYRKDDIVTITYYTKAIEGLGAFDSRLYYNYDILQPYNIFENNKGEKFYYETYEKYKFDIHSIAIDDYLEVGATTNEAEFGSTITDTTALATFKLKATKDFNEEDLGISLSTTSLVIIKENEDGTTRTDKIPEQADNYLFIVTTLPNAETPIDTDADTDITPVTDTDTDSDTDSKPDITADTDSDTDSDSDTDIETDNDTDSEPPVSNKKIPSDALVYNNHSYYVYSGICGTWEEAKAYCESLGGYLAVINDQEENDALFNYVKECGYDGAYFGYTDSAEEGVWQWVNNKHSDYTNWAKGEPNHENSNEDYAMFYFKFTSGQWNDGDFNGSTVGSNSAFICEWDSDSESDITITDTNETKHFCGILDGIAYADNGTAVNIDGKYYLITESFDVSYAENILDNYDSKLIAAVMENGKITRADSIYDIAVPKISVNFDTNYLTFSDGKYNASTIDGNAEISLVVKEPYSADDFMGTAAENISADLTGYSLKLDSGLYFMNGTEKTTTVNVSKDITLTLGSVYSEKHTFYIDQNFKTEYANDLFAVEGTVTEASGKKVISYSSLPVNNFDVQTQKAEELKKNSETTKKAETAKKTLDAVKPLITDGKLKEAGFDDTKIGQIDDYIKTWISGILAARMISENGIDDAEFNRQAKESGLSSSDITKICKDSALTASKMYGVDIDNYDSDDVSAQMTITLKNENGKDDKVTVSVDFKSLDIDKIKQHSSDFAALRYLVEKADGRSYTSQRIQLDYSNISNYADDLKKVAETSLRGSFSATVNTHLNENKQIKEPVITYTHNLLADALTNVINNKVLDDNNSTFTEDGYTQYETQVTKRTELELTGAIDFQISAEDGLVCGTVTDGEVNILNDSVFICCDKGVINVNVSGGSYTIKLTGKDYDTSTYTINEFINNEAMREIKYEDISMAPMKVYIGFVPQDNDGLSDVYNLIETKERSRVAYSKKSDSPKQTDIKTIGAGDVDGDAKITAADSLLVLRASVNLETFDKSTQKLADVNENGKIESADSLYILRYSVGLKDDGNNITM